MSDRPNLGPRARVPRLQSLSLGLVASALLAGVAGAQNGVITWGQSPSQTDYEQGPLTAAAASVDHVIGLRGDGSLIAWGLWGSQAPQTPGIPPGRFAIDVAAGRSFCLALLDDGSIVGAGSNSAGQLLIPPPPAGQRYIEVDAGDQHALALLSNGDVVTWGQASAAPALPAGVVYRRISTFFTSSAAVRSDGAIVVWDALRPAQLQVPPPPPGTAYVDVSIGAGHVLGLSSNGSVLAWGGNAFGETDVPALPAGLVYTHVAAGGNISYALRSDGAVVVFGNSQYGLSEVPTPAAGTSVVEVLPGWTTAALRRDDGELIVWGTDLYGLSDVPISNAVIRPVSLDLTFAGYLARFDDGRIGAHPLGSPNAVSSLPVSPGALTWRDVDAGGPTVAGVRDDGAIQAHINGQLSGLFQPPPGLEFLQVSIGWGNFLATLSNGEVQGFGSNSVGQNDVPAPPPGLAYVRVAAAGPSTAALRSDGVITVVGIGPNGELDVPALPPGTAYLDVSGRFQHFVALRSDGRVVAWGLDTHGQNNVPALPAGTYYVEAITSGTHALARRSDGAVVGWGLGSSGELAVPSAPAGKAYARLGAAYQASGGVLVPDQPGQSSVYCAPAAANSVSATGAALAVAGHASHELDDTVLAASDLPPGALGILVYGSQQASLPLGNGTLCVGGSLVRVLPPVVADAAGRAVRLLDLDSPQLSTGAGAILPGSTWNFQLWYRDAAAPPAFFNFSSAVQTTFAP